VPIHLEMQYSENQPTAAFTPSATIVNIGALQNIEFTNNSTNGVEYLWNFGDGTTSTEEHPQHSYSSPGTYTVSLATINQEGCSDIEAIEIEAVLETSTTSQNINNQIKVFPNPTKDLIHVQFDFDVHQEVNISVIDLLGRQLTRRTKKNYQTDLIQLDLKNNSQGIYYVIFEFDDQKIVKRVVKI